MQPGALFTFRLLVSGASYPEELAVFQPHRRQRAAPDAAAVEHGKPFAHLEPERRPVAADDAGFFARPQLEPRLEAGRRRIALGTELHLSFRRAEAHARHRVDDDAQPVPAGERVAPAIRRAAV